MDIFIPNRGSGNLYHFLFYMVSSLKIINFVPNNIYVNVGNNYVIEVFNLLYPNSNVFHTLICPSNCFSVPEIPATTTREEAAFPENYIYLRNLFMPFIKNFKPSVEYSKFIYISREDAECRRALNETHLLNSNKFKDFQKIVPSSLSLLEQMYIFNNAEIIIGVHGAGLSNILFCNDNCKVIEIVTNQPMSRLQHFEKIASTLNLKYVRFTDTIPIQNGYDENSLDMIINIEALHSFV
jgi:capsular polysaccharide biosynthesis protein